MLVPPTSTLILFFLCLCFLQVNIPRTGGFKHLYLDHLFLKWYHTWLLKQALLAFQSSCMLPFSCLYHLAILSNSSLTISDIHPSLAEFCVTFVSFPLSYVSCPAVSSCQIKQLLMRCSVSYLNFRLRCSHFPSHLTLVLRER